jgi:hypothetical protein
MKTLSIIILLSLISLNSCKKKKKKNGDISIGDVTIGKISAAGNGCLDQKIKFSIQGLNHAKIDFSPSFKVVANKSISRASCQMALPIKLPKDQRLVISILQLKGRKDLPNTESSEFKIELFEAGKVGQIKKIELDKLKRDFTVIYPLNQSKLVTECGANSTIRINTSILLKDSNPQNQMVSVSEISFPDIQLENCAI